MSGTGQTGNSNKGKTDSHQSFLFADDCALNTTSEQAMQTATYRLSGLCDNLGLTVSTKETEVSPALASLTRNRAQFSLMWTSSRTWAAHYQANIDVEVKVTIAKASSAFGRLRENVCERRGISLRTKLKVYQPVVISILLYVCDI